MTERKAWTAEEDAALRQLYEQRGIKKWAEISRLLTKEFRLHNRSGKQCRQRYHNHLDSSIKHQKWTQAQQMGLIELHNQIGNKWAEISRRIPGRSQNCIKNQFYSILRRGLRRLNALIRSHFKRRKEIEVTMLNKLVENDPKQHDLGKLKQEVAFYAHQHHKEPPNEEDKIRINSLIEQLRAVEKGNKQADKNGRIMRSHDKYEENKLENFEKESDEIDSEEYRDKCPAQELLPEFKGRKNSLYTFRLEKDDFKLEQETDRPKTPPLPPMMPHFRRKSSHQSNQSNERYSPRLSPKCVDLYSTDSLQLLEGDFCSPRGNPSVQSPYFDQLRVSYSSWHQFYSH